MKRFVKASIWSLALTMGLALGLAKVAGAQSTATDPASVLLAWEKVAFGTSQDIDAALALMTDDAVLTVLPAPPPGTQSVWTGKTAIRQALAANRKLNVTRENVGTPQVDGNKVTVTAKVSNNFFQMLGVVPVEAITEAVVEGGKIKSYTSTLTPVEQARVATAARAYQAAHSTQTAQQPIGMPRTGAGAVASWVLAGLLLVTGVCLVLAGAAVRRSRPRSTRKRA